MREYQFQAMLLCKHNLFLPSSQNLDRLAGARDVTRQCAYSSIIFFIILVNNKQKHCLIYYNIRKRKINQEKGYLRYHDLMITRVAASELNVNIRLKGRIHCYTGRNREAVSIFYLNYHNNSARWILLSIGGPIPHRLRKKSWLAPDHRSQELGALE